MSLNILAHKGFLLVQLWSHLSSMSLPGTRGGNIHQREGSEVRNLQKILSPTEDRETANKDAKEMK